ncbi:MULTISPECIES: transcription termination factor Rho [unclassified Streptomyces]|uniref:transcription termination factor Rho n=1 Tax=unclassified Streptomyces TaxID=2593676 RepID=UPI00224D02B5|nr:MULTISPECIES: transcription termination factor Rho [unclassified Streptomyces]WSP53401.1 transcription termination factor Rho [Streptomyces sp. NBC_01241]WSU25927.1 transcription termination factor Rho [Streptomyces sp. NBC_01108]MCX4784771.1 transcription termination factor Rho [Streptomyces sp. NBC_01221]MCX4799271.1 transcription termination factor Rho [Streptomyces sp. NBC_01242]WSJ40454.1 transcription termination factor Rho [Streptomyces sp. NBC_01321]
MTSTLEHPVAQRELTTEAVGVLDITHQGHGALRVRGGLPSPGDVQVSTALIRRHGLRKGDAVEGSCDRPRILSGVVRVNGRSPQALRGRPHFGDLTPLHPRGRLRLETPSTSPATRLVDLVTPIGKGQRGLVVAPPRTGKTVLLQQIAAAVAANHPECHLMVVLLDERPEEVTDMRRSVRGEVLASTFDRPAKEHIALAELAVERAKRLVEQGQDVVILLDSLTRLCRAHNNASAAGGRTLSGGVDATALLGPKRLFGAARLTEEGGSLTILATALVETGSRADDYFFEELKSTGNMELRLDRALADRRTYPAVNIQASGTRREELIVPASELRVVRGLRRALHSRDPQTALSTFLDRIRSTPDNAAFLRTVHRTVPDA